MAVVAEEELPLVVLVHQGDLDGMDQTVFPERLVVMQNQANPV